MDVFWIIRLRHLNFNKIYSNFFSKMGTLLLKAIDPAFA
jgi:hypothetical protein